VYICFSLRVVFPIATAGCQPVFRFVDRNVDSSQQKTNCTFRSISYMHECTQFYIQKPYDFKYNEPSGIET